MKATNVSMVDTDSYRAAGLWRSADTLAELADLIGLPADALEDTVARYNAMVAAGADTDFGRGDEAYDRAFSGGESPMVAIDTPPFHAAAFGLSDLGTKGGLRTDARARVLDESGEPIPRPVRSGQHHGRRQRNHLSRRRESDRRVDVVQLSGRSRHGR